MNAVAKNLPFAEAANLSSTPAAPWQVYELGLQVNQLIEQMYHLLKADCSGPCNGNDKWIIYNRKEAEQIKEKCTFFRNCELNYFYQSGGLMAINYEEPINRSALKSSLNWLMFKLNRNVEICESTGKCETKLRNQDIYQFITTIRNDVSNFYRSSAALYPPGAINKSFISLNKLTVQSNCKMFNSYQIIKQQERAK